MQRKQGDFQIVQSPPRESDDQAYKIRQRIFFFIIHFSFFSVSKGRLQNGGILNDENAIGDHLDCETGKVTKENHASSSLTHLQLCVFIS